MYIVEIFLPLTESDGQPFHAHLYASERKKLIAEFGGLTVYSRTPATGFWDDGDGTVTDSVIIFEVMAGYIDTSWWEDYRSHLEQIFRQESIIIRALGATIL